MSYFPNQSQLGTSGGAIPPATVQVGGSDGTAFHTFATDTSGRAIIVVSGTVPISGTVAVSNLPATQPVSGSFYQAVQPVSGSVSVANLPASQAVTGTFWQATQPISVASLPLPSGAATSAAQAAAQASLATIASAPVNGLALGAKASAGSWPVVLATDQASLTSGSSAAAFARAGTLFGASTGLVTLQGLALGGLAAPTPLLLITNPTGSTKVLTIHRLTVASVAPAYYLLIRNPTVTANGTALALLNRNSATGVAGFASKAYQSPTVTSGTGTIERVGAMAGNGVDEVLYNGELILAAGTSLAVVAYSDTSITGLVNSLAAAGLVASEA